MKRIHAILTHVIINKIRHPWFNLLAKSFMNTVDTQCYSAFSYNTKTNGGFTKFTLRPNYFRHKRTVNNKYEI